MVDFISERVTISHGKALPSSLNELARQRFSLALGRFGTRVQSLSVRLRDLNGPRGGPDKLCTVAVRLNGSPREIVVHETDADPATAIYRAADRTARAVARAVAAIHDWRSRRGRHDR